MTPSEIHQASVVAAKRASAEYRAACRAAGTEPDNAEANKVYRAARVREKRRLIAAAGKPSKPAEAASAPAILPTVTRAASKPQEATLAPPRDASELESYRRLSACSPRAKARMDAWEQAGHIRRLPNGNFRLNR